LHQERCRSESGNSFTAETPRAQRKIFLSGFFDRSGRGAVKGTMSFGIVIEAAEKK